MDGELKTKFMSRLWIGVLIAYIIRPGLTSVSPDCVGYDDCQTEATVALISANISCEEEKASSTCALHKEMCQLSTGRRWPKRINCPNLRQRCDRALRKFMEAPCPPQQIRPKTKSNGIRPGSTQKDDPKIRTRQSSATKGNRTLAEGSNTKTGNRTTTDSSPPEDDTGINPTPRKEKEENVTLQSQPDPFTREKAARTKETRHDSRKPSAQNRDQHQEKNAGEKVNQTSTNPNTSKSEGATDYITTPRSTIRPEVTESADPVEGTKRKRCESQEPRPDGDTRTEHYHYLTMAIILILNPVTMIVTMVMCKCKRCSTRGHRDHQPRTIRNRQHTNPARNASI